MLSAPAKEKDMYRIAGIDVHKELLVVVIAELRADGIAILERRKFWATPEQMRKLAERLLEWEVEEVVMESTAQYWQPVRGMLEEVWQPVRQQRKGAGAKAGNLYLAQAQSNKGRRGRKNDYEDVKRLVAGELVLSFVPEAEQRLWRTVTRRKNQLNKDRSRVQSQLECVLEQAHIKLASVISDLLGVSAVRILRAIAEGKSDPVVLAGLVEKNVKATPEQLADALSAVRRCKADYRKLIQMMLDHVKLLDEQVDQLLLHAARLMKAHEDAVNRLAEVPGLGVDSGLQIVAEVGPQAEVFPTPGSLCSWVGAIPGEQVSADKNASSKSPKGNRQMRRVLTEAVEAAIKQKGNIFEVKFRKFIAHMDYQEAIWCVVHFMCKLVWKILHDGVRYEERGPGVDALLAWASVLGGSVTSKLRGSAYCPRSHGCLPN
jgi:transposase